MGRARWFLFGSSAALLAAALLLHAASGYPVLQYYVTDQAGVLLDYEVADIEEVCDEVYQATGAEMAVLIVDTTQPDGIDLYAVKTFEASGIGQAGEDNGLLLLVSVSESAWRVEVGYGLEGILPDLRVAQIAWAKLVPYLNQSDYYTGIALTMIELGLVILDEYEGSPPSPEEPWYPIPWLPLLWWQLLVAVAVMLVIFLATGRLFLLPLFMFGKGGKGGFGGGSSGGGGASGKF